VRAAGGNWAVEDLAQYRVVEREPIRFSYRGYDFVTAPPPSSGGAALAQIFHVLSGYDLADMARVDRVHLLVEAMRRAYRDRAIYLGDPDFVRVPLDVITSPVYAAGLRASINTGRATPSDLLPGINAPTESADTTHFSIVDGDGNMVAMTQTVNLPYGNAVVVPGTGFLLNNEMDDFSVKPGVPNAFGLVGEDANAIAPGKRPLSSMTPTFLIGPERMAAIGTPGGSRIITMVLLGLLDLMDGDAAQEVVSAPRYHHQYLPDAISTEPGAFAPDEIEALRARGHAVTPGERPWGNMQVVIWDRRSGATQAGSDPRWKGVGKGATGNAIYR
jgi:gamma-glutamyltranspeptidase/glutathione hydrolase